MIGLVLLTVVSLLAMARRVHTRGRIGSLASVVTAIIGAIAGGNLALLALDVIRDRQAARPRTAQLPSPAAEAQIAVSSASRG